MNIISPFLLDGEIICLGLFAGLMLALIVIFRPMLDSLSATEYVFVLQRFLKFANKNLIISMILLLAALFPLPILITSSIGSQIFTLTILAWFIFMVGVIVVTVHVNLPLYRKIAQWDVQTPTSDWQRVGKQWYLLNYVRGIAAGISLVLFLIILTLLTGVHL